ncbi:hypothetical protein [Streptomyces sp. NPDC048172]|uniref:hypothetical protein n=1 Tax=Streptomyces sp. NPDC048172 TaxID=3365505 RepID=UPI0037128A87
MPSPDLTDLAAALDTDAPVAALDAMWDVFDVAEQAADSIAFREGYDEVMAAAASGEAAAGKSLMPLPDAGQSYVLAEEPERTLPVCAALLEKAAGLLDHVATGAIDEVRTSLRTAAGHARGAARNLRAAPEPQ